LNFVGLGYKMSLTRLPFVVTNAVLITSANTFPVPKGRV
jgi:hypothetical protein